MATVTGKTAAAMQAIADASVVGGSVNGSGHLILTKNDASTLDAGSVVGPTGPTGPTGPIGATGVAPTGSIVMFSAQTPPAGWLLCTGQAVSRTTFAALFAVIGTTYGAGNGTTTFTLPNLLNRYPRMDSVTANLAGSGGATSHTHPIASHSHNVDGGTPAAVAHVTILSQASPNVFMDRTVGVPNWSANIQGEVTPVASSAGTENTGAVVTGKTDTATPALAATGSNGTDNIPPYLNLNFIIKT
jgi:microcystin-dependent protein